MKISIRAKLSTVAMEQTNRSNRAAEEELLQLFDLGNNS